MYAIRSYYALTYTKSDTNTWAMSAELADSSEAAAIGLTYTDGTTEADGTVLVTFNEDGTLASPENLGMTVTDWTSGAADSTIDYQVGTADKTDGLSQYASSDSDSYNFV